MENEKKGKKISVWLTQPKFNEVSKYADDMGLKLSSMGAFFIGLGLMTYKADMHKFDGLLKKVEVD